MKKNIFYLLFLLPALMFQSCLKNQEDTFDDLATHRLTEYNEKAKSTLMSSEYGWVFEIFPKNTQEYGGYVFTCKFDEQTATIMSEPLPGTGTPKGTDVCYYKLSYEDGPTLIFDTYSPIMHYFAEGSSKGYQAYGGDTEYVIDSIGNDIIKVHGARSKNKCYLYRLTVPAEEYLASLNTFQTDFWDPEKQSYSCMKGTINGEQFNAEFLTSRQMEFTVGENDLETEAYTYTPNSLRLYKALTVGGVKIREFAYDMTSHNYTAIDEQGNRYPLEGSFPQWVINYDSWAGNYELMIRSKAVDGDISTLNVSLEPVPDRSVYLMKGVNPNYDLELEYNKAENSLTLHPQLVGEPLANGNVILLAGWSSKGFVHYGLYTTKVNSGMKLYWSESEQMYKWTDNGAWGSYKVEGWCIYVFKGTSRVGYISLTDAEQAAYAINGNTRIYGMVGLKRQ